MQDQRIRSVFVTAAGSFLPGPKVSNEEMEQRLGLVGGTQSRLRRRILKSNGIESRHYAVDNDGRQTHLNEELAAEAVRLTLAERGLTMDDVDMLAFGTTMPDVLIPGFASMVHGRLGGRAVEILSSAGVCASGIGALRAAMNAIKVGDHDVAVAGGSELSSQMLKSTRFQAESKLAPERVDTAESFQYFNADFLRWMLSDGAGAVVLESKPRQNGLSLRVEWVESLSHAHEWPTCMYLGLSDPRDLSVGKTFLSYDTLGDAERAGLMVVRQDTKLLASTMHAVMKDALIRMREKRGLEAEKIDWYLPHLSSYFFGGLLQAEMVRCGFSIPEERWFTNLRSCGNTGAASFYVILSEALSKGLFPPGQKILAMIPESGRFVMAHALFTVVGPRGEV